MKLITDHLGQIIAVIAAISLLITSVVFFKGPVGLFFENIIEKETSIGDKVFANLENVGMFDGEGGSNGGSGSGGAEDEDDEVPSKTYLYGDAIDQGDYRYIYIGCEDYEEYKLGALKRLIHTTAGSSICTTEDEVFDVLAYGYLGCTWAEAQAQGYTKEQVYQLGGVNEDHYNNDIEDGDIADGWIVWVHDTTQKTYESIPAKVDGIPVVSLCNTFMGCTELTEAPDLSEAVYVTNMSYTFDDCTALTEASVIPSSVTNMSYTFDDCTALTKAPAIPSSVTDMTCTFQDCTSLTTAPDMSKATNVTDMSQTFIFCTALTKAPAIPNSVTNMYNTFQGCTSLTTAPAIPNSVTNMENTFLGCTSLTTAPDMSKATNVTSMSGTFSNCTSLSGSITINATPDDYRYCFAGVDFEKQNLTLAGSSTILDDIGDTGIKYCVTCNGKCAGNCK